MSKNGGILLLLFLVLIGAAYFSGTLLGDLYGGLIGAIIGSVTSIYLSESQSERLRRERFFSALEALRTELKFNLQLQEGAVDYLHIEFSTFAWQRFAEFINEVPGDLEQDLMRVYALIARYSQCAHVDIVKSPQIAGNILLSRYYDQIKSLIPKVLSVWPVSKSSEGGQVSRVNQGVK